MRSVLMLVALRDGRFVSSHISAIRLLQKNRAVVVVVNLENYSSCGISANVPITSVALLGSAGTSTC